MKFLLILFCLFYTVFSQKSAQDYLRKNPKLKYVGEINGKMYFREPSKVNWMDARELCKSSNLEMGEIGNPAEWSFVYEKNKRIDMWVGGAMRDLDEGQHDAFVWESGAKIRKDVNLIVTATNWLCLYVDGGDKMYVDKCVHSTHQVLCQAKKTY